MRSNSWTGVSWFTPPLEDEVSGLGLGKTQGKVAFFFPRGQSSIMLVDYEELECADAFELPV